MNISALLNATSSALTGSGTAASQATAASSGVSPFLAQVERKVQADVDATSAQISKFGLVQSALSDAQTAAKAMAALPATASAADTTTALANFFNTVNSTVGAAHAAATATAAGSESARRVLQDIRAALGTDPTMREDMKKLGLSLQTDGTLVQDAKKFADALHADPSATRAAMASMGTRFSALASTELGSGGAVGSALTLLTGRKTSLSAEQTALKTLEQAMASASTSKPLSSSNATASSASLTGLLNSGLASYRSTKAGY